MALIGYEVGNRWQSVMHGFSDAGYVLGAVVVLGVIVVFGHRYRSYKADTAAEAAEAAERAAAVRGPDAEPAQGRSQAPTAVPVPSTDPASAARPSGRQPASDFSRRPQP
jgi:hypothetical protein